MLSTTRKIQESPLHVGKNEVIVFTVTTTPWATSPSSVSSVTLYDVTSGEPGTNVSGTNLSGSPSLTGDVITLPAITGLIDGSVYLLRVKFVKGSNAYEAWAEVHGER